MYNMHVQGEPAVAFVYIGTEETFLQANLPFLLIIKHNYCDLPAILSIHVVILEDSSSKSDLCSETVVIMSLIRSVNRSMVDKSSSGFCCWSVVDISTDHKTVYPQQRTLALPASKPPAPVTGLSRSIELVIAPHWTFR